MKNTHGINISATSGQIKSLNAIGIKCPPGKKMLGAVHTFVAFDISEDDPIWPHLQILLRRWKEDDGIVTTEFSIEEIEEAKFLEIGAWLHGYPQPNENEFGYFEETYKNSNRCEKCGIGLKQTAPFQMKGEPKWGRNGIMQLNWVFGELFVKNDVWKAVFEPHGIGCRPVMNRKGIELQTVVQLVVDESVGIHTEGLESEHCDECGLIKYSPVQFGMFPSLKSAPANAMVKTIEYFGSGA